MTLELAYDIEGPAGAPTVLLLNSLGASGEMWKWQLGPLAEQFRVLRIDAPGHGRSPASSGTQLSIAELGADVLAVLDHLELDRVHIAGLSLGGMIGAWLAAHHPQRVARLVLLCTSAHPGNPERWHERAVTVRAEGMAAIAGPVVGRWITPELSERDPGLVDFLSSMLTGCDPETYAQCCEVLGRLDLRPELAQITARTLVISAADDLALPPTHQHEIADAITDARLVSIAPAAHIATVEQAGQITSLLLEHLGGGASMAGGFRTRRSVLGDSHVDRSIANTTPFTAPFQEFITRYAWGDVWTRPGLARRERSIATLAVLVTLGADHEIAMHVRAAVGNGLEPAEISEVLLHTALYAGLPRANRAFAIAQETLAEFDRTEEN